ncbi:hypothetical protein RQP46_001754 [Phenoliferia psychrophenolica]
MTTVQANGASGISCINCGKPANRALTCPKCKELGFRDSVFCSNECFKDNYKTHKAMHKKADAPCDVYPEGTVDPFIGKKDHKYTGPLRAIYPIVPVPKREVPASIPRPDYALNTKGNSMSETVANKMSPKGRVHTKEEIAGMRKVCTLAREVLDIAAAAVRPGITTLELDEIVHAECIKRDSYPSPLGYHLFPRSVCTSVNEVICHGIPDARPLVSGDIINLDVTLYHAGFHGDLNATYPVGDQVSDVNLNLIATTRSCLDEAIRACKPGTLFRDIGGIIEPIARAQGFATNRTYVGHGINQLFHCAPNIAHYANSMSTVGTMKAGMIFTIEPMICTSNALDLHWPDNWTAVTKDGKPSAQFEETLLVTATGVEVLTAAPGWELPPRPVKDASSGNYKPAASSTYKPYGATGANEPLLGNTEQPYASGSHAPSNDWAQEGSGEDDVPEDFKIGMTVSESSQSIRHAFVAKVYGVLFCQIVGTTVIGALMSTESASTWVQANPGLMMIPMFGAIAAMLGVYWKRHSHPLNIILLGLFTVLEAITVGSVVGFYSGTVVLQALVITVFVFLGLTLFTFQSKYDFDNMGSYLFAALLCFVITGFVGIFLPFNRITDMLMAGGGCILFSLYIVYDTHLLLRRLHMDDWVLACVSLYLDILNLFLQILRLLSDIQER